MHSKQMLVKIKVCQFSATNRKGWHLYIYFSKLTIKAAMDREITSKLYLSFYRM